MSEENKILSCPKCQSQNVEKTGDVYHCISCGCEWRFKDEELPQTQSLTIRNSTAEFLIFQAQSQANGVEVFYQNETLWLTQKAMGALFDVGIPAISKHLKNIFEDGELIEDSVISKMETTAADGKNYMTKYYNLDAVISVGYRVNTTRATQFRQWATAVLRQFAIRGYVLDKKRMEKDRKSVV